MHYLEKIKEKLCKELERLSGEEKLTAGSIEYIHKLSDTIKNIDKIMMLEDDGYSQGNGDWEARGTYGGGRMHHENSYNDGGNSYRGRRRDSMGRYSRDDGKEQMVRELREMMEDARTEKEREAIRRCINQIESA